MPSFDMELVKERSKTISADTNLSVENKSFNIPAGMLNLNGFTAGSMSVGAA